MAKKRKKPKLTPETQARLDDIKRVWRPGMTAADIAHAMRTKENRQGISGLFYRHKDYLYPISLEPPIKREKEKQPPPSFNIKKKLFQGSLIIPATNKITVAEPALPDGFRFISLQSLTDQTCRFPSGDHAITFCGLPVEDSVYCRYHRKIAYPNPTIKGAPSVSKDRKVPPKTQSVRLTRRVDRRVA